MNDERQCGDVDVSLNAIVGTMIDRSHVEDVFEIGKGAFDLRELLVKTHGFDRRQMRLFSLDNVLAFVSLLADKMHGMFEEAKHALLVRPIVIAMAVITLKNSSGSSPDLLSRLEPAAGDTSKASSFLCTRLLDFSRCARSYSN